MSPDTPDDLFTDDDRGRRRDLPAAVGGEYIEAPPRSSLKGWHVALIAVVACVPVLLCVGGVLLALLLPALQQGREAARRSQAQNNLKQIGLAGLNFETVHGSFPPWVDGENVAGPDNPPTAWMTAMLPYMDEQALSDLYDPTVPWDDPANALATATPVDAYLDPSHPQTMTVGHAASHFAGNVAVIGPEGVKQLREITDGTASTIFAGEIGSTPAAWADPDNLRDAAAGIGPGANQFGGQYHPGGGQFVLCDGSVRFISLSVDPDVFKALGTPDGGETVGAGAF